MFKSLEDFVAPLVQLKRIPGEATRCRGNVILVKLEGNNPARSVKDRPALSMILRAEAHGGIKPGDTLIEATSGNTAIALAMAAAIKGYGMILVMPDNQSLERRQTMRAFGAELVQTLGQPDGDGWVAPPREDLAALIGFTTETASRVIAELKREGLLTEIRGWFHFDRAGLAGFASCRCVVISWTAASMPMADGIPREFNIRKESKNHAAL